MVTRSLARSDGGAWRLSINGLDGCDQENIMDGRIRSRILVCSSIQRLASLVVTQHTTFNRGTSRGPHHPPRRMGSPWMTAGWLVVAHHVHRESRARRKLRTYRSREASAAYI